MQQPFHPDFRMKYGAVFKLLQDTEGTQGFFFSSKFPEHSIEYEAAHSKNSDWLLDGNFPQR